LGAEKTKKSGEISYCLVDGKIVFQSSFMLTMVQPLATARESAKSPDVLEAPGVEPVFPEKD
jgi:hypothetical protein